MIPKELPALTMPCPRCDDPVLIGSRIEGWVREGQVMRAQLVCDWRDLELHYLLEHPVELDECIREIAEATQQ